jgi:hypothetical protein
MCDQASASQDLAAWSSASRSCCGIELRDVTLSGSARSGEENVVDKTHPGQLE